MALLQTNNDQRSKLQEKIAKDLESKKSTNTTARYDMPESTLLEDQHTTNLSGIFILVLIVAIIGFMIYLFMR